VERWNETAAVETLPKIAALVQCGHGGVTVPKGSPLCGFFRFVAFFKEPATHVFEGQKADAGRLGVSTEAPIKTQRAFQLEEMPATAAAIGSPIIGPAARSVGLEIGRQAPDQLQK
jgi:hypothetical protein